MNRHSLLSVPEVLSIIFSYLLQKDVYECQKVCKAWYLPAHILSLNNITLTSNFDIAQFLRSIEYNPRPIYLNAVKNVTFGLPRPACRVFLNDPNIRQIMERIPSIKNIFFQNIQLPGLYQDELWFYKDLVETKHSLETVDCVFDDHYLPLDDILASLNPFLRKACLGAGFEVFNDVLLFLNKCHSLQELDLIQTEICMRFAEFLALFEVGNPLKKLVCRIKYMGGIIFTNEILNTLNTKERIIERLSKLEDLSIDITSQTVTSFGEFATCYLTGLKNLRLSFSLGDGRPSASSTMDCARTVDFAMGLPEFDIDILDIPRNKALICLPKILNQLFENTSHKYKCVQGTVVLCIKKQDKQDSPFDLSLISKQINSSQLKRSMVIYCMQNSDSYEALYCVLISKNHSTVVKAIELDLSLIEPILQTRTYLACSKVFNYLLRKWSTTIKLTMDIPGILKNYDELSVRRNIHHLELLVYKEISDNIMLQHCLDVFPEVKELALYYSSGVWNRRLGIFEIKLNRSSLERMLIDVTPAKTKSAQSFGDRVNFFILTVCCDIQKYLYKVSLDHFSVISIEPSHIENMRPGKDYIEISIQLASLRYLSLALYSKEADKGTGYTIDYFRKRPEDMKTNSLFFNVDQS